MNAKDSCEVRRPRALIMTVGVAADPKLDITPALAEEIESLAPEQLVLIASGESHKNAQRLAERVGRAADGCWIVKLDSPHDLEETFGKMNEAVDALLDRGIAPGDVAVNFTSGTKMMGSGCVLSAVFKRCLEMRYITGAQGGSRRRGLIKTHPAAVFAYQDLLRGRNLALELRFGSAGEVLESIDDSLLTEGDRDLRQGLLLLARSYDARESFDPAGALETYGRVKFDSPMLDAFRMDAGQQGAAASLARELKGENSGPRVITELFNNGMRRLETGAADDAVTRLYRAMEMLAQWILRRDFGIDTDDVDTRPIPPRDRVAFEALRSMEDGLIKIGLRKAYDLLMILGTPVGERFMRSKPLQELLARRRGSILAHGLSPMGVGSTRAFFGAARGLFLIEIEDFDRQCRLLQFPWVNPEPFAQAGGEREDRPEPRENKALA